MFVVVLLVLSCYGWRQCAAHEWSLSCGDAGEAPLRFAPAGGGDGARYDLRWCTNVTEPLLQSWAVYLYVIGEHEYADKCPEHLSLMNKDLMHSKFEQSINKTVDCGVVCLSTYLDLVYRGCYQLRLVLHSGAAGQAVRSLKHLLFVDNQYTLEDINREKTWFTATSAGDKVVITIYNQFIPLDDYYVQLCNESKECWSIGDSCQPLAGGGAGGAGARVRCAAGVRAGAAGGRLRADLSHAAPWVHGAVFAPSIMDVTFNFTHGEVSAEVVGAGSAGAGTGPLARWAGAALGAALGGALLLAAWLWWRRQPAARWRESVARAWKERYNTVTSEECSPPPAPAPLPVLLLYARDAEPFMRAMSALRRLLHSATQGEVYDLFTPAAAALSGGAPAAWVRAQLAGGARVVLVQSLAGCLYAGSGAGAAGPALLPRRVQHRVPAFGDTLLQYALRSLQLHAHAPGAYTRYYVCSISSLPAEMMSGLVPFRRYELPGALGALLRDLGGRAAPPPSPPPALEDEFRLALREHVQYVREHDNYLQEDLLRIL